MGSYSIDMVGKLRRKQVDTRGKLKRIFIELLECYEDKYLSEVEIYVNEKPTEILKLKDPEIGLTIKDIKKFIDKIYQDNPNLKFTSISASGHFVFSKVYTMDYMYREYVVVSTGEIRGPPTIRWGYPNFEPFAQEGVIQYKDDPDSPKRAKKHIPLSEIKSMFASMAKKMILVFDPDILYLCSKPHDYIHWSDIIYFKDLFNYCLEYSIDNFDSKEIKYMDKIKKVITRQEIVENIRKSSLKWQFDLIEWQNGGIELLNAGPKTMAFEQVLVELKNLIRKKGVDLPKYEFEYYYDQK